MTVAISKWKVSDTDNERRMYTGIRRNQTFGNFGFLRFFFANSCRIFGRKWESRKRPWASRNKDVSYEVTWQNFFHIRVLPPHRNRHKPTWDGAVRRPSSILRLPQAAVSQPFRTIWSPSHFKPATDILTHISLASHFWDISKQCRPRSDAAERGVWSGSSLFADRNIYSK